MMDIYKEEKVETNLDNHFSPTGSKDLHYQIIKRG